MVLLLEFPDVDYTTEPGRVQNGYWSLDRREQLWYTVD
jgi:hypothetical protein